MTDTLAALRDALKGRYRIERELGAGGMATVYLAHDDRHDRMVALKVLRPELAAVIGADRFLVEIKTTANLQHPNILALHDSGEVSGTVWYVMPLVEGESLRERLTRETQLPVEDAIAIAREVASALDYAHRHGVVHRDIKPENILLHDGRAVVADFGIALAMSRTDGGTRLTETGMSLGTPHYMSPEQALGERTIDARTDVYALGVVLYEMLTGEPPFTGPSAQAIIAKLMKSPPPPIVESRPTVPAGVEAAVMRALSKLPADRFKSAAEFSAALQTAMTGGLSTAPALGRSTGTQAAAPSTSARAIPWAIAAVAILVASAVAMRSKPAASDRVTAAVVPLAIRTPMNLPQNEVSVPISIAPDGSFIVFVGPDPASTNSTALWMRRLDQLTATVIPGTSGAQGPIVADDGKSVQFLTRAANRVSNARFEVRFDGSLPQPIASYPGFRRLRDGGALILDSILVRVRRGDPLPQTSRLARGGMIAASPDGHWSARTSRAGLRDSIVLRPVDNSNQTRIVLAAGSSPLFLDNDLLAFQAPDNTLQVARLAPDRTRVLATVAVLPSLSRAGDGDANYAVGEDGTLIYMQGSSAAESRPVWVTSGRAEPIPNAESRLYGGVAIAPNGRRAALTVGALTGAGDIWITDLANGSISPLTSDGVSTRSTWTRDSKSVTYLHTSVGAQALRDTVPRIYQRTPDAGAPADSVIAPWRGGTLDEIDWSPDMRYLAVRVRDRGQRDVAVWRVGTDSLFKIAAEPAQERGPRISPDGTALLYVSDRSGHDEVYVESFPRGGNRTPVSTEGGREAMWSRDGSKIFYRSWPEGWMMSARVSRGPAFTVTKPERLFDATPYLANQFLAMYDVAPNGRFLMFKLDAQPERTDVVIIRNWAQQVRAQLAQRAK